MTTLNYSEINSDVLGPMRRPGRLYWLVMLFLLGAIGYFGAVWLYQIRTGMGVAGINHPVGWGCYIGNFVFWVGIAHSGTLISAILHLLRAKWRTAVSRSAEAMTIFAVATAGLFPLIHLGRVWIFYFILPYPSERQLWPNFISPLVWDVCAVGTYFTVSLIFWFVGLVPDIASARDRWERLYGPDHPRSRIYRKLSLGWSGAGSQWRHFGRAYLFFAALATPLVISVHSVVSFDFSMGLLPGWHSTIFAPYFVAGAIHSGLAMVLTLIIPLRRLFRLDKLITVDHFASVAKTMLVTTAIMGYSYIVEPFIDWYSGETIHRQFLMWRWTDLWIAMIYWPLPVLNVLVPALFVFKRVRRNLKWLFAISILVNIGMWLERLMITVAATAHDFLPHNWDNYQMSWVEWSITGGSFAWFFFWFFAFSKTLPTVPMADVKEQVEEERSGEHDDAPTADRPVASVDASVGGVVGMFGTADALVEAVKSLRQAGYEKLETYTPMRIKALEAAMGRGPSPVRLWTLLGAIAGCAGGFALAIWAANVNGLIVGGKHPTSIVPYCIVAFEGTILLGTLGNLAGLIVHARLGRKLPRWFDPSFTNGTFGLFAPCRPEQVSEIRNMLPQAERVDAI